MKALKTTLSGFAVLIVAAQFIRPSPNTAAEQSPADIALHHPVPAEVQQVLSSACYDCHSNNTRYPWYTHVQPVGWWLSAHINQGKRHLNFSEFGDYSAKRARHKLDEVIDELKDGSMPLKPYPLLHPEARLSDADVRLLSDWAKSVRDSIPPPPAE